MKKIWFVTQIVLALVSMPVWYVGFLLWLITNTISTVLEPMLEWWIDWYQFLSDTVIRYCLGGDKQS